MEAETKQRKVSMNKVESNNVMEHAAEVVHPHLNFRGIEIPLHVVKDAFSWFGEGVKVFGEGVEKKAEEIKPKEESSIAGQIAKFTAPLIGAGAAYALSEGVVVVAEVGLLAGMLSGGPVGPGLLVAAEGVLTAIPIVAPVAGAVGGNLVYRFVKWVI